jgi:hypothetical protein
MIGLLGCCSCGGGTPCGSKTITVTVRKCSTSTAVASASVVVKDGDGATVATGSTNVSGVYTATVNPDEGEVFTIEVSKTGFKGCATASPATDTVTFTTCVNQTITIYLCPTTFNVVITHNGCSFYGRPNVPATYAITGDISASGSVTLEGTTTIGPFTVPDGTCSMTFTVTLTASAGYGATTTYTNVISSWTPLNDYPIDYAPTPATGSVQASGQGIICGDVFMPEELDYSDDYGSCTLTYGSGIFGSGWLGSYEYTSNNVNSVYGSTTDTVQVNVRIAITENCTGSTLVASRRIGASCDVAPTPDEKAFIPADESATNTMAQSGTLTSSGCSTSTLTYSASLGAWSGSAWASCTSDSDPELSSSADISGSTAT